ncbi:MAG: outer membrane protein assembly factor BamE, partial [Aeromonas sp.]
FQPGHGELERKELTVTFTNEQLSSVTGDFPLPAAFNTPL